MSATNTTGSIFQLFYTHTRAGLLLSAKGVKVKSVEKISINKPNGEFYKAVFVVYRVKNGGRCATFLSCRDFLARATEKRREEAAKYTAYQEKHNPSECHVYPKGNPSKVQEARQIEENDDPKYRTVHTTPDVVYCDCPDFNEQSSYLSQHPYLWQKVIKGDQICKHSLCALSHLGQASLSSYLKFWQPGGRLNSLAATMNRTSRASSA